MSYLKSKTSAMLLISASFLGTSVSALAQNVKVNTQSEKAVVATKAQAESPAETTASAKETAPEKTTVADESTAPSKETLSEKDNAAAKATPVVADKNAEQKSAANQSNQNASKPVNLTPEPKKVALIGDNNHALTVHELAAHELVNNIDKTSMKIKNISIQKKLADAQYDLYSSQKKLAELTNTGELAFGQNKVKATPISETSLNMIYNKNHKQIADISISGKRLSVKTGDVLPAYNLKVVKVTNKQVSLKTIKGNEVRVLSLTSELESI